MSVDTVIVNYGSPRSGTTFMRRTLGRLNGAMAFKLAEGRTLHPCQSDGGLIELHKMLRHHRLVIVRTVRHPLDIVDSFIALREPKMWGKRTKPINLAKFQDARVLQFIRNESENTAIQREELREPDYSHAGIAFIEVRYETLASDDGREALARQVTEGLPEAGGEYARLLGALEDFGVRPAGVGKLKSGMVGDVMAPADKERWRSVLAKVIEREGYA